MAMIKAWALALSMVLAWPLLAPAYQERRDRAPLSECCVRWQEVKTCQRYVRQRICTQWREKQGRRICIRWRWGRVCASYQTTRRCVQKQRPCPPNINPGVERRVPR